MGTRSRGPMGVLGGCVEYFIRTERDLEIWLSTDSGEGDMVEKGGRSYRVNGSSKCRI